MKIAKYMWFALAGLTISCTADQDIKGTDFFKQYAVVNKIETGKSVEAEHFRATSMAFASSQANVPLEQKYSVTLLSENTKNVDIHFATATEQVQKHNKIYGTSFLVFPSEHLKFTEKLSVEPGKVSSEQGTITITPFKDMLDNTPYMVALSANSSDVDMMHGANLLLYVVEKVKGQIKQTYKITRNQYFAIEGTSGSHSGNLTIEGLIYVEKFRGPGDMGEAGISTFMGVEGKTLLRFGDASVEPNHLQANGQDIGVKFKTDTWYHIAITINAGITSAYVNGEKVTEYAANGNVTWRDFFIGRSWSENRGINARFAELKVWTIARTGAEIKENMFDTDPNSQGLFAYWKMSEAKNNRIPDASGNGRNLVLYNQTGGSSPQDIKIFSEETPIKL